MNETVLVTGGTGYIASWCIVELLQRGYAVRATLRDPAKEGAARLVIESAGVPTDRLQFVVADLTRDDGWDAAAAGCSYMLHVASPLGSDATGDPNALIVPARDGTLRALRAATKARVKRVVMTSAAAAARPPQTSDTVSDENVWADPSDVQFDAYRRSKILAERAAWEFMADHSHTEFTTILPGAVFGPILAQQTLGSVQVVRRLLEGRLPGLPRIAFWIVDVRDLADLHVRAMTSPAAAGERYIATGDLMWMEDIALALRENLASRASKVPTRRLPNTLVNLLSLFVPPMRLLTPSLGRRNSVTSEKARRVLGFAPRPAITTVVDCAESLLRAGAVRVDG